MIVKTNCRGLGHSKPMLKDKTLEQLLYFKETLLWMLGQVEVELDRRRKISD
jgi:hypothetical protein